MPREVLHRTRVLEGKQVRCVEEGRGGLCVSGGDIDYLQVIRRERENLYVTRGNITYLIVTILRDITYLCIIIVIITYLCIISSNITINL